MTRTPHSLQDHAPPVAIQMGDALADWQDKIETVIGELRRMAGTSESKFLQIGEQMQDVYQKSLEVSQIANQLVATASGQNLLVLSNRLRLMASDMESFLGKFQSRSKQSAATLSQARELLDRLDDPLDNVQTMARPFYMLEVFIKIHSARLGEIGNGFVILATDINTLSGQVADKVGAIKAHRSSIFSLICKNLSAIEQLSSIEEEDAQLTLKNTLSSLHELDSANERFTQLGDTIASIVKDISSSVGEVVSSLQFHDINRQQVEHIIAALERLAADFSTRQAQGDDSAHRDLIMAVGDVCEMQEAQLHFASAELYTAVATIIDKLREVANQQSTIQQETTATSGVMDESGVSFIDAIRGGLSATTALLTTCANCHHQVANTMEEMASTLGASASFVKEIDGIGYNIVKTALNAQIKAGQVGQQGAALATLAEEIRRLSNGASQNTGEITSALHAISNVTADLINESSSDESSLSTWLVGVELEIQEIMTLLGEMKEQLRALVADIQDKIGALAGDIDRITSAIDVHEQSKGVADEALGVLQGLVNQARELVPASNEFKAELRKLNKHYTMESERRIHQLIASRHDVGTEVAEPGLMPVGAGDISEFGDNVDLF